MTDKITLIEGLFRNQYVCISELLDLKNKIETPYGYIKDITLDIQRNMGNKKKQDWLKKKLPVVLVNGIFGKRLDTALSDYSCYICIDLDYNLPNELSERDSDWVKHTSDPYVKMAFHSPRGGIKLIIQHDSLDPAFHKELYSSISGYLGNTHIDSKCDNLSRAHFISYDPKVYYNADSEIYHFVPASSTAKITPYVTSKTIKSTGATFWKNLMLQPPKFKNPDQAIKKVQELSDRYFPVSRGFRNSNLFRFACKLHDYGVSKDDALMYLLLRYVEPDFDGTEIEGIVNSAYK